MPEVNTFSNDEWEKRKTFITAYREGLISRNEFCLMWSSMQILKIFQDKLKEGKE